MADGLSVLDSRLSEYRDPGVLHRCASHSIWDTMATHQYLGISLAQVLEMLICT